MNGHIKINGSPTVDGYYTTFDSSEVHRLDVSDDTPSGGGGSSDFSTAEVTFIDTFDGQSSGYSVLLPTIQNDAIECINVPVSYGNPATVTLPLYKGEFVFPLVAFTSINEDADPTASGDVDVDFSQGPPSFIVTGDGTVSWESQEIF